MAQITSGIRFILSSPAVYNGLQRLLSGQSGRSKFCQESLPVADGNTVLDIGCGTAELLEYFPLSVTYFGFDISPEYIAHARRRYVSRKATFYAQRLTAEAAAQLPGMDLVYAGGLLHHLDDDEVHALFTIIATTLKPGGRLVTVDPCFVTDQRRISRFLVARDRGQNIRTLDELTRLAKPHFRQVQSLHRGDLLRVPYDHAILECQL